MSSSRPPTASEAARGPSPPHIQEDSAPANDETGEPAVERDDECETASLGGIDRVDKFTSGPQTSARLAEILECLIQGNAPEWGIEDCFHYTSTEGLRAFLGGNGYIWRVVGHKPPWGSSRCSHQERLIELTQGVWPKSFGHLVLQAEAPAEPELLEPPTVLLGAFYWYHAVWGGLERTVLCWKSQTFPRLRPSPSSPLQFPSLPPPPPAAPRADFSSLSGCVW